jgi:hypothetical protein
MNLQTFASAIVDVITLEIQVRLDLPPVHFTVKVTIQLKLK